MTEQTSETSEGAILAALEHFLKAGDFEAVNDILNTPDVDWRVVALIAASVTAGLSQEDWEQAGDDEAPAPVLRLVRP